MGHEENRQKQVAKHLANIKERRTKLNLLRKHLKDSANKEYNYVMRWVRMPVNKSRKRNNFDAERMEFWSIEE